MLLHESTYVVVVGWIIHCWKRRLKVSPCALAGIKWKLEKKPHQCFHFSPSTHHLHPHCTIFSGIVGE